MSRLLKAVCLFAMGGIVCGAGAAEPWYLGTSGGLLLPGNGNSLRRAAEVSVRAGVYASDFLAWEVEGACAPNVASSDGNETLSGVGARGLFHLAGIEEVDLLFGCERFDPFVTLGVETRWGAREAFADRTHRTMTGPAAGIGAFYHLTNSLDLRFDARAALGCDSPCGLVYCVGLGLQWNFGGEGE